MWCRQEVYGVNACPDVAIIRILPRESACLLDDQSTHTMANENDRRTRSSLAKGIVEFLDQRLTEVMNREEVLFAIKPVGIVAETVYPDVSEVGICWKPFFRPVMRSTW